MTLRDRAACLVIAFIIECCAFCGCVIPVLAVSTPAAECHPMGDVQSVYVSFSAIDDKVSIPIVKTFNVIGRELQVCFSLRRSNIDCLRLIDRQESGSRELSQSVFNCQIGSIGTRNNMHYDFDVKTLGGSLAGICVYDSAFNVFRRGDRFGEIKFQRHPRSLISVDSFAREIRVVHGNDGVCGNQDGSYFRPSKLPFFVGIVISALSLVLLFKIIDKINLDARFNEYMAIGGFFVALGLFCAGAMIALWAIGMF